MSVCTTCLQHGLPAGGQHDCPGIGEIQVSRHRGRGVVVDAAPARALLGLRIIRDIAWPANIAGVGDPDLVNIADQVLYRVTGYDPATASLIVELVEDWRPKPTAVLSEADVADIKARWREAYGKPGTAHPVTELREDTACTPMPAATLMQMTEAPPELRQTESEPDRPVMGEAEQLAETVHTLQTIVNRVREAVAEEQPMPKPTCTATIEGPHTGGDTPVRCALDVHGEEQMHESAPRGLLGARLHWTDHHAGATPHQTAEESP